MGEMMNAKPPRRRALLAALILACTLSAGFLGGFFMPRDDDFFALRKNFEIFGAVYKELVTGYVEPVDPEALMRDGVDAMLSDLDPYTTFIDEAESTDLRIITQGQYGGVGLNIGRRGGKITVTAPIEGASGYEQGVRTGDVLTRVDGRPAATLSMADVQHLLRGEPGTTVELTVERAGVPAPLTFTLTREKVTLKNVTYRGFLGPETGGIGYLRLERFTRSAGEEVRAGIRALQKEQALAGLVLDLRGNPGGLLGAAVDVVQLFVPEGSVVVSTRGRTFESERVYRSQRPPLVPDVPLVVLVDAYSASASEIVAGAVQDLDRGVIVGTTTFGKGLVQVIRELPYNTALKMTTAKYYTPSGRSIQAALVLDSSSATTALGSARRTFTTEGGRPVREGHGIEPDVAVAAGAPSPLEEALRRRAAFFFFANAYAAEHPGLGASFTATDATVAAFQAWLEAEDVSYQIDAERSLDELASHLQEIGFEDARDEARALRAAIRAEKAALFDEHAEAIKEALRAEILTRYVSQTAQIEASLEHDPQTHRAAELLRDPTAYANILE